MRVRFVLCRVALAAFRQAIRPCGLKNFSVNAAPPTWLAISDRIFFFRKPPTAFLSAFKVRHFDDLAVKAAPTPPWLTHFLRFLDRVEALTAARLAIVGWPHVNVIVNTAVAVIGRWRGSGAAAVGRAGQRPPKARRRT